MLQVRTISAARSATVMRSNARIWPTSTPRLSSSCDVASIPQVYDDAARAGFAGCSGSGAGARPPTDTRYSPGGYRDVVPKKAGNAPGAVPPESWASSPGVRSRMQQQPSRNTTPELALRSELHRRGLRYRVHVPILDGRRKHDIVFTKAGVVVEVLGCFWHRCPKHGTPLLCLETHLITTLFCPGFST